MKQATHYLLRLDDLCPTSHWAKWNRVLTLAAETGVRPLLAVLPRNEDPELRIDPPDAEFWPRMRALEASGSTIALHGFTHLCRSRGRGLLPLHNTTEFAGAPIDEQRRSIRAGLALLREEGLTPRLWIAPRHGFDRNTLRVLREEGIHILSDGFARVPYRRFGLTWLPQQLWGPVEKGPGLWTLLLHPNTATEAELDAVEDFLRTHKSQFLSLDEALENFPPTHYGPAQAVRTQATLLRIRLKKLRKFFY